MLKIGITGGIGSGKTTVCNIFMQLGVPVYFADIRAKELMTEDKDLIRGVKASFGDDIYINGELDRKKLASIVFTDEEKLKILNNLVHPAVFRDYRTWAESQESDYIIKEAALMFESGSNKDQDYVVNVSAPDELRIKRVMERDRSDREQVVSRMKNQLSEKERLERADFVIYNNGKDPLIRQVLTLHHRFLELSRNKR